MARVDLLTAETAPPKAAEALAKMAQLNIFRTMAHGDGLLPAFSRFGGYLLNKTKLDPVLREIAIIRVGVLSKAKYEIFQHERIGREVGMSDALIAACHEGPGAKALDDVQHLVVTFTDDVVHNVRAGDKNYDALAKHLSMQELQELVIIIGYYMLVSRFLETFDVAIEKGGPPADFMPGTQKRG